MCVISFANCWSVFPSDLAMAPSVRRAFWETAGETSELAKARSSNASVDSLKKKMKARIQMRWQMEKGRRWRCIIHERRRAAKNGGGDAHLHVQTHVH